MEDPTVYLQIRLPRTVRAALKSQAALAQLPLKEWLVLQLSHLAEGPNAK